LNLIVKQMTLQKILKHGCSQAACRLAQSSHELNLHRINNAPFDWREGEAE